jgi:CRISPR/Cas system CSM-associated protein Csm4 (group 5 of RAMP superfamily)
MTHVKIGKKENVRYIPSYLTMNDKLKQKQYLNKSRKYFNKNKYFTRPKINSYKNRRSNHTKRLQQLYKIKTAIPNKELSDKSKCSIETLKKIIKKGKGAYFSSGSRPNQTPSSWGYARLASALTGGNAAIYDFKILENGCQANSKTLKLAKLLRKKRKK